MVSGLTNGTKHAIRLRAVNAAGPGAASDVVEVTPATTPGAPSNVKALAGDRSATVSFAGPADDGGAVIANFEVKVDYSDDFRRQAVDLYESTPGASVRGIAEDLGVELGTLREWLRQFGTGRKTGADGKPTTTPFKALRQPVTPVEGVPADETPEQRIRRLEARVRQLEADHLMRRRL